MSIIVNYEEYQNICRICLFIGKLRPIIDSVVVEIIHGLSGTDVQSDSDLPQKICEPCYKKIYKINEFALQCKRNELTLKKCKSEYFQLKNNETEAINIKEEITTEDDMLQIKQEMKTENNTNISEPIEFLNIANISGCDESKSQEEKTNDNDCNCAIKSAATDDHKCPECNKINEKHLMESGNGMLTLKRYKLMHKKRKGEFDDVTEHSDDSLNLEEVTIKSEPIEMSPIEADEEEETETETDNIIETKQSASTAMSLLSAKSRSGYRKNYDVFMEWCNLKHIDIYNEAVLLDYFLEKSKLMKSSSLWSIYSMLKSTLALEKDVDISKFKRVTAFLKQKSAGYKPNKCTTLTRAQIYKFLSEAPDEHYLMMKVVLLLGVAGACRRDELVKMTIDNVEDNGSILIVKIPDSSKRTEHRTFIVEDQFLLDVVSMYRRYVALRPSNLFTRRLFISYKDGKCSKQVVGMNTIGKIPFNIATYLNLPNPSSFNGHCFRKSSTSFF